MRWLRSAIQLLTAFESLNVPLTNIYHLIFESQYKPVHYACSIFYKKEYVLEKNIFSFFLKFFSSKEISVQEIVFVHNFVPVNHFNALVVDL